MDTETSKYKTKFASRAISPVTVFTDKFSFQPGRSRKREIASQLIVKTLIIGRSRDSYCAGQKGLDRKRRKRAARPFPVAHKAVLTRPRFTEHAAAGYLFPGAVITRHYAVFPFEVLINRPPHSCPRKRTLNSPKRKQRVTAKKGCLCLQPQSRSPPLVFLFLCPFHSSSFFLSLSRAPRLFLFVAAFPPFPPAALYSISRQPFCRGRG